MNLFKYTLLYKFGHFISSYFTYIKELNYIKDTFYSDEFKLVLKKYLKLNVKKDWLGRLYGIINPIIDINGNIDVNNIILELDDNNTNNKEYVQAWMHKQLSLIADLFHINKLYDYINLTIKKVGPIQLDNYLVIFDIVARQNMSSSFKKFGKHFIFYIILVIVFIILKFYMNIF